MLLYFESLCFQTLLIGSEIFFFEVQAFGDSLCNNLLTSDSLSSPEAFAHLDFTVDLNLSNDGLFSFL